MVLSGFFARLTQAPVYLVHCPVFLVRFHHSLHRTVHRAGCIAHLLAWDSNLWILVSDRTRSWDSTLLLSLLFRASTSTRRFQFCFPAAVAPVSYFTSQHNKELWDMLSHVFLLSLHHPGKYQHCSYICLYPTARSLSWFLSLAELYYTQPANKLHLQISSLPINYWNCYPGSGHHFSPTAS